MQMDVARTGHLRQLKLLFREFPVVALLGARQVGKSTLARQLATSRRGPVTWFDLEDPTALARLADPARSGAASRRWRDGFIRTFLTRDIPELGSLVPAATLRRFWSMLAHWHGQRWNGGEFGRAFGISHTTVRRYLDALTSVFAVRQLPPWHENIAKRQVRSPKVYVGDSGILHALLGLTSREEVVSHPKVGASWEGFVIGQVIQLLAVRPEQCFHWATHAGAELDLLVTAGGRRYGFEVKRAEAPRLTRSMRSAFETLNLRASGCDSCRHRALPDGAEGARPASRKPHHGVEALARPWPCLKPAAADLTRASAPAAAWSISIPAPRRTALVRGAARRR